MPWLNLLIFWFPQVISAIILVWLLRLDLIKKNLTLKHVKNAVIVVIVTYLINFGAQIGYLYLLLRKDPIGSYLLPGRGTSYFSGAIWSISQPFIFSLGIALFWLIIAIIGKNFSKRPILEGTDVGLIFLTTFVTGYPNAFIMLLGSLILMVIFQIAVSKKRLSIGPFLIITTLAIIILSNFNIWDQFTKFLNIT